MKTVLFLMVLLLGLAQHAGAQRYRPGHYRVVRVVPSGATVIRYRNYDYHYHPASGYYYRPYRTHYRYVVAPRGIRVAVLPAGYRTVVWGPRTYYYSTGVFYVHTDDNAAYEIVDAPRGAVVAELPDGAEKVTVDGQTYFTVNGTYYKPVANGYEVVGADADADKDE